MAGGTGGRAFAALPLSVLEQNGVGPGAQALCVDQLYANVALAAVDGQVVAGEDQILAGLAAVARPDQVAVEDHGIHGGAGDINAAVLNRDLLEPRPLRAVEAAPVQRVEEAFLTEILGLYHGKGPARLALIAV